MAIKVSDIFPELTRRQSEVCALLIQGVQNKVIARQLNISPRTVEDHRTEIFRRADVIDARELVYKAVGSPAVTA